MAVLPDGEDDLGSFLIERNNGQVSDIVTDRRARWNLCIGHSDAYQLLNRMARRLMDRTRVSRIESFSNSIRGDRSRQYIKGSWLETEAALSHNKV